MFRNYRRRRIIKKLEEINASQYVLFLLIERIAMETVYVWELPRLKGTFREALRIIENVKRDFGETLRADLLISGIENVFGHLGIKRNHDGNVLTSEEKKKLERLLELFIAENNAFRMVFFRVHQTIEKIYQDGTQRTVGVDLRRQFMNEIRTHFLEFQNQGHPEIITELQEFIDKMKKTT